MAVERIASPVTVTAFIPAIIPRLIERVMDIACCVVFDCICHILHFAYNFIGAEGSRDHAM